MTVYLASVVESHVNITNDCKLHWPVMSNVIVQNVLSFPNATGQKQTKKTMSPVNSSGEKNTTKVSDLGSVHF